MSESNHYDVIVVGIGSMGSATCYNLSKSGAKVLGIDQFNIPHEKGSHAGQSRLIRKAYMEDPRYVPLLLDAYRGWKRIEEESGEQLYYETGIFYSGKHKGKAIKGITKTASKHNIYIEELSNEVQKARYPQFNIPANFTSYSEPEAGFITPEKAIDVFIQKAIDNGVIIHTQEQVIDWQLINNTFRIQTNLRKYSAEKIVFTAGAWTDRLIPALSKSLNVTQQLIAWVKPFHPEKFKLWNFPCWMIDVPDQLGTYYGFPILDEVAFGEPVGLKIGHHRQLKSITPEGLPDFDPREETDNLLKMTGQFIPEAMQSLNIMKSCLYTNTPDEHFIIDFLPEYNKRVAIAAGFSGHGFKFAPVIGKLMSEMIIKGEPSINIDFLKLERLS